MSFKMLFIKPIEIVITPKLNFEEMCLLVEVKWNLPLPLQKLSRFILLEKSLDGKHYYPIYSPSDFNKDKMIFKENLIGYQKIVVYRIKVITKSNLEIISPIVKFINKFKYEN